MKRGALDHRDEVGGGARDACVRKFDDPSRFQRLRNRIDGGEGAQFAGMGEISAEPRDAQPGKAGVKARDRRHGGNVRLRRVPIVAAEHGVIGEREVANASREPAHVVETGDERERSGARQSAIGRLEAEHATEGARHANRSVGVRSERDRNQAAGDGGPRSAGRSARHMFEIMRIARRAVVGVLAGEVVGVFAHVERADQDGARGLQTRNQRRVGRRRRPVAIDLRAGAGRQPCHVIKILDRERRARQRAQACAAGARRVDPLGLGEGPRRGHVSKGAEGAIARVDAGERLLGQLLSARRAGFNRDGHRFCRSVKQRRHGVNTGAGSSSSPIGTENSVAACCAAILRWTIVWVRDSGVRVSPRSGAAASINASGSKGTELKQPPYSDASKRRGAAGRRSSSACHFTRLHSGEKVRRQASAESARRLKVALRVDDDKGPTEAETAGPDWRSLFSARPYSGRSSFDRRPRLPSDRRPCRRT